MNTHRFARLRLHAAIGGWLAVIAGLVAFIYQVLSGADFLMSKWPQGKAMPIEVWLFTGGLVWLTLIAFWPELDSTEQPDVALMWEWPEDRKHANELAGRTCKDIVVHNRSDEWIYNVHIHPIKLHHEMRFDFIPEVPPFKQTVATARWNGKSSITTEYIYFFSDENNDLAAAQKKWNHKKLHARGFSEMVTRIPMRMTYEVGKRAWEWKGIFNYDGDVETWFEKVSNRRI